jgi:hypothetical protein
MVFRAVPLEGVAPGALLTGLPTQAASAEITKSVTRAERTKLVAESASVRAGRIRLFMGNDDSFGLLLSNNR